MNKRALGVIAVILIALAAIVAVAGFDKLPRQLHASVDAAATRVQSDRSQFDQARAGVLQALNAQPQLFRRQASLWQNQLTQSDNRLRQAEAELQKLRQLEKANRREDREAVTSGLSRLESLKGDAVKTAQNLRTEADRWIGYQRNLPKQLSDTKSAYETLRNYDIRAEASAAQKAIVDWPQKKDDFERRFQALEAMKRQAEEAWNASAAERAKAESGDRSSLDYATLFAAGEAISGDLREVQQGVPMLKQLAAQLYVGRDKLLLELDDDNGQKQKVRVVETKYADAALSSPQVSNREEWENVDASRMEQLKKSIGMVVERKPAGKYDSEAEKVLQPPGYAYIAPPGQSNQYGSWNNGVWGWLPQYLLLSQMLRTNNYPPIGTRDWNDYDRSRRRGDVWYGRSGQYGGTWSGGGSTRGGGSWSDRVRGWGSGTSSQGGGTVSGGSTRARDGWNTGGSTYGGSRYENRGGYGGSRYQSRPSGGSGFGSRGYSRGGTFGRGGGRGGRR
ncbi:MAG: hypothetical protein H7039_10375 [Bryobacteraceae bacterium]|nr:hypothetical protein [Bryobacteraceae bacterium]